MIDIKTLRSNPETLKAALARRGDQKTNELLDGVLQLDASRRVLLAEVEDLKRGRNEASQEVAKLKKSGGDAGELIAQTRHSGEHISAIDADVREVVAGLRPGLTPGLLLIDTSTVSAQTAREIAAELRTLGVGFIDAPLSGGVEGAKNGKLSVMAGGAEADLARALPALESFAARITLMGPVGAGQATKAVNQIMIGGIAEGVCEALAFADALGLPRERLLQVLTAGAANSWFLEKRGQSMFDGRFDGGFKLALLHKDLGIVREMAAALGASLPTVERAFTDYSALKALGHGEQEISSLFTLKRELFGDA